VSELSMRLLGGFELESAAGAPIALPPKKARALLAYLALSAGRPQSRDRLAALLWEEADEAQARTSLRQALSAIRKALPESDGLLEADTENIRLDTTRLHVDALELSRHALSEEVRRLEQAANLYRGHLLDGLDVRAPAFEDWLRGERERLRQLAVEALSALIDLHLQQDGAAANALFAAMRLLALDPVREDIHRAVMRIYAAQGRHAAALEQYRRCREILRLELGVPPEPETEKVYREIHQFRHSNAQQGAPPPAGDAQDDAAGAPDPAPPASVDSDIRRRAGEERANAQVELRHATVFLTDISGFTPLVATGDPEELHDYLLRYRELVRGRVRQYGGIVTNYIGARVMAVFGVPVAHGNDPERAVLAALAIRDGVPQIANVAGRQLQVHIGIANGPVLATREAGGLALTGGPVSVAARIMESAPAGEVRASNDVREAIGERLHAEALPDARIDALLHPLQLWRIRGLNRGPGVARPSRFIGREVERRQLGGMLEACLGSGLGRAVLIRGDAGIGKSSLTEEFSAQARVLGFAPHGGNALEYGGEAPVAQLLCSLLGAGLRADNAKIEQAVVRAAAHGHITPEASHFLAELAGLSRSAKAGTTDESAGSGPRQSGRRSALAGLITALAARQPLLLLVEDIHWADAIALEYLSWIAAAARQSRIILVMTTRTDGDPLTAAWRNASGGCPLTTIDLGPLSEDEALRLAARYGSRDPEFTRNCVQRAEGNPLFLEQLLRAGNNPGSAVPGSLQNLILARLDRLETSERQALQAAAVLGQRFALDALRHLLEEPDYAPGRALEQGLLNPDADGFRFAHALIQEAVYGSLLRSRRLELHAAAARWFASRDPEREAHHLAATGRAEAAAAYARAARIEAASYRREHALALITRAMAFATDERSRCDLLLLRGEIQGDHGETEKSVQAFGEALHLAQDDAQRLRAWVGTAAGLRILDRYDRALAALEHAERLARELDDRRTLMHVHSLRGNIHFPRGEIEACLSAHEQARKLAMEVGTPADMARVMGGLGDAYFQSACIRTAQGLFERCIALAREARLERLELTYMPMLGVTRFYTGDALRTCELCHEAAERAMQLGEPRAEALARLVLASTCFQAGRYAEARSAAERGLELSRRLGARRFESDALLVLGMLKHAEGDTLQARTLLDQAYAIVEETGPGYSGPWVLGSIALANEDPAIRKRALALGEQQLAAGCVSHNYFHFYENAIEVALALGEWEEVERFATALEHYTRREPLPWTGLVIARGRALARCGRGERDPGLKAELQSLRSNAEQSCFRSAIAAVDAALAEF